MAIEIDEVNRAMVYRNQEARKEALTGEVRVLLTYNEGKLTKATMERKGPLFPGMKYPTRPPENSPKPFAGFDEPGKNRG